MRSKVKVIARPNALFSGGWIPIDLRRPSVVRVAEAYISTVVHGVKAESCFIRLACFTINMQLMYTFAYTTNVTIGEGRGGTAPGDTIHGWHPNEINF